MDTIMTAWREVLAGSRDEASFAALVADPAVRDGVGWGNDRLLYDRIVVLTKIFSAVPHETAEYRRRITLALFERMHLTNAEVARAIS